MKKNHIALTILIFSILFPMFSIVTVAEIPQSSQSTSNSFVIGIITGTPTSGDPAIHGADLANPLNYECMEKLVWMDTKGNVRPMLAESWITHARADETSSAGLNTGGIAAIEFTLRQGVTFHDGSEFNATVVKWNFDRSTNISMYVDQKWKAVHWMDAAGLVPRFTTNWNLTDTIAAYNATSIAVLNKSSSSVPVIKSIDIISPYVVNITFNKWAQDVSAFTCSGQTWFSIISMEAYKDYSNTPMKGYGDDPAFPQDDPATFPGHMIGTGAYVFDYLDVVGTQQAHATKNMNYWNRTTLEADGYFSITDLYLRIYADYPPRSNALLTGEIDWSSHMLQAPITDVEAVKASPNFNYIPTTYDASIDCITFLNQEGLDAPITTGAYAGQTPREIFPDNFANPVLGLPNGTELPTGINRTTRRALTWAFDYDGYTNIAYSGGTGVRTTSPYGVASVWYDPSVPHPDYNITKAREILMADPYMAAKVTARGLSMSNSTEEWKGVALLDPIQTFSILTYDDSFKNAFIEQACNDLGFAITLEFATGGIWPDYVYPGLAVMYDMFIYIWINDVLDPTYYLGLLYKSTSRRVPHKSYNYAHLTNDTIDDWITNMPFIADKQGAYNEMADSLLNYHAPWIYMGQMEYAIAINAGWNYTSLAHEYGGPVGIMSHFAEIGGTRLIITPPPGIPGFPTALIYLFSLLSVVGLIYVIKRKKF